ncbi:MAG: CBS domain-containing protein [Thermoanaerobaculia bacterium]
MAQQKETGDSQLVRDFMTANPECVSERDTVRDAARIMKEHDTGVVPVIDGKKIVGLITDRDIVVRGVAERQDVAGMPVSELMTKSVRTVRENADMREVLELMRGSEIRRVPVVNGSDEIVGIVSLGDIASESQQAGAVGKAMEKISEAPPNN